MLKFCFGASGAGKSTGIYKDIIEKSIKDPGTDFLIIVPDQFTMQTQKDVVLMHPSRAIMNIDVLSFGRLSHRIFEETGHGSFSVLDDVGKSLVLRHVSDMLGERLPVIGKNMHKSGYIDEVKSTISEFMMYGIDDKALETLEEASVRKGALNAKLKDLRLLYSEFLSYIEGKFITTEENLDILTKELPKSRLIRNSVIVFDGFTGFTPIQYRVIKELMALSKEVIFTITISPKEDPYSAEYKEHELFMLSKKTVRDIEKLEYELQKEAGSDISDFETYRQIRHKDNSDVFYTDEPVKRLMNNPPLAYLEKTLFRYAQDKYKGDNDAVSIYAASNQDEEIRQTMIKIADLVRTEKYAYRDIALVCGSLESYSEAIQKAADKFDIPVYVDQNTNILLNPFIEYITSALNITSGGYRYEDVFHYMRSGMTGFENSDTDLLENYVRALGISGQGQWEDRFVRKMPVRFKSHRFTKKWGEKEVENLNKLEEMRAKISSDLKPLSDAKKGTAQQITDALVQVIENGNCREKLQAYSYMFGKKGDLKRQREYEQIYDKVMDLFEQVKALIGGEKLTISEYMDILNAGFGEIALGTIPQDADRIIVGDIERTRLKEVRVLFFVGVNDGNIPSNVGSGGILSDIDRQFLIDLGTEVEFAPTPRQQMYIQRLYLYMNLTKPTDKLFLSYAELGSDGKSLHPAYLISKIKDMFEGLNVERPEDNGLESQLVTQKESMDYLAPMLRDYATGILNEDSKRGLFTLLRLLKDDDKTGKETLLDSLISLSFMHYKSQPLAKAVALALYGANLENSVSRLEQFAGCAYAHFIKYGLSLDERQEYEFNAADLGNVFHKVLEKYTGEIISKGIDWKTLSKEDSDEILNLALTECADAYGDTILRSSARNQYMIERIRRILVRTVDTLKYQISKGSFSPAFVEMKFEEAGKIDELNIALTTDEKNNITENMRLTGKIDRVDLYEDPEHVYVKVMDFKSGAHRFDIASLYYGLQLQLVMYMDVASAVEKRLTGGKDVVPAAILYYHVDDPIIDGKENMVTDDINKEIISKLKMTGLVNSDRGVIDKLDNTMASKSDIIPVEFKKDGNPAKASQTASIEEYRAISGYVQKKIREFGTRILDGDIEINPYDDGKRQACTYCSYRSICGYDEKVDGFKMRKLDISKDDAMAEIIRENGQ